MFRLDLCPTPQRRRCCRVPGCLLSSRAGFTSQGSCLSPSTAISCCQKSPDRLYPHLLVLTLYFYSSFLLHLIPLITPMPLLSSYFRWPSCLPCRVPRGPAAAPRQEEVPEAESRGREQLRACPRVTSPMLRPQKESRWLRKTRRFGSAPAMAAARDADPLPRDRRRAHFPRPPLGARRPQRRPGTGGRAPSAAAVGTGPARDRRGGGGPSVWTLFRAAQNGRATAETKVDFN